MGFPPDQEIIRPVCAVSRWLRAEITVSVMRSGCGHVCLCVGGWSWEVAGCECVCMCVCVAMRQGGRQETGRGPPGRVGGRRQAEEEQMLGDQILYYRVSIWWPEPLPEAAAGPGEDT